MIVRMGILSRKEGLAVDAFRRHWRDVHGPLAAKLPGLLRYQQNHVVAVPDSPLGPVERLGAVDGISELWFGDVQAMRRAMESPECRPLAKDEAALIDGLRLIVAEPIVMVEPPRHRAAKCMTLI